MSSLLVLYNYVKYLCVQKSSDAPSLTAYHDFRVWKDLDTFEFRIYTYWECWVYIEHHTNHGYTFGSSNFCAEILSNLDWRGMCCTTVLKQIFKEIRSTSERSFSNIFKVWCVHWVALFDTHFNDPINIKLSHLWVPSSTVLVFHANPM